MRLIEVFYRLRPNHLVGQTALLTLAALLLSHFFIIFMFHILDIEGKRHYVAESAFIASMFYSLDATPQSNRGMLIEEITTAFPYANIVIVKEPPARENSQDPVLKAELARLHSNLWRNANIYTGSQHFRDTLGSFVLELRDGEYAVIAISQHKKPSRLLWRWAWEPEPDVPFFLTRWARLTYLFLICSAVLIVWLSNTILRPLVDLARQAEAFPDDDRTQPGLIWREPEEVKNLRRSIGRMQDRILNMISAQKYMIAAVSHDLRSMITRLKLRVEFIKDDQIRYKIDNDLKIMETMLDKNLEYLKAGQRSDSFALLDIDSVLQTIADEFNDAGYSIVYDGGAHQKIMGSLSDTMRIFTNLVENAVHHSENISIHISSPQNGFIEIDVIDDGPGIDPDIIEGVFEPYVRGDIGHRLGESGGFGLGLSIVRSLVRIHGGDIELINRNEGGLIARVRLPVAHPHDVNN
jgi:signal transduction histidine kinase